MTEKFHPTEKLNSVYEITPGWMKAHNARALICDLDDTLVPYFDTTPTEQLIEWIGSLRAAGIRLCILTNGKKKRVKPFCARLGVTCVPMAMKPLPLGYLRAVLRLRVSRKRVVAVGDQIFTDVIGANLAGIQTLLVEPIAYKPSRMEKFKREKEKPFRHVLSAEKQ